MFPLFSHSLNLVRPEMSGLLRVEQTVYLSPDGTAFFGHPVLLLLDPYFLASVGQSRKTVIPCTNPTCLIMPFTYRKGQMFPAPLEGS